MQEIVRKPGPNAWSASEGGARQELKVTRYTAKIGSTTSTRGTPLSSHPNFDDGGAVVWHTDLTAAQDVACQTGKLLFIECGRLA